MLIPRDLLQHCKSDSDNHSRPNGRQEYVREVAVLPWLLHRCFDL